MPITRSFERDKNLTVFKVTGQVPFDEFRESVLDYYNSGATKFVLFDLREAEGSGATFSYERIAQLAKYLEHIRKGRESGKTALVSSKDLYFGLARMLEALQSNSKIEYGSFRSMDEAFKWLDE